MKKILVVNGHPNQDSFNTAIAKAYIKHAESKGASVRYLAIGELKFNPNLEFGYSKRMDLEPDLLNALEDISWSDHQVWIHPIWWSGMPAIMKGFFDRAFLPGIAFKTNENTNFLQNKTSRIINTAGDMSLYIYEKYLKSSGVIQLKSGILEYCGVSSVKTNFIGPLEELTESDRLEFLESLESIAEEDIA